MGGALRLGFSPVFLLPRFMGSFCALFAFVVGWSCPRLDFRRRSKGVSKPSSSQGKNPTLLRHAVSARSNANPAFSTILESAKAVVTVLIGKLF
jgi:hypothetical protein